MKIQKTLITTWLIIGMATMAKAQQHIADTAGVQKLAQQTGISPEKAITLKEAFNYKKEEIQKLLNDKTMPGAERIKAIRLLLDERRIQIAALKLTADETSSLKQKAAKFIEEADARHAQLSKQNDDNLRKLAIKVTGGSADLLKKGNTPQ